MRPGMVVFGIAHVAIISSFSIPNILNKMIEDIKLICPLVYSSGSHWRKTALC